MTEERAGVLDRYVEHSDRAKAAQGVLWGGRSRSTGEIFGLASLKVFQCPVPFPRWLFFLTVLWLFCSCSSLPITYVESSNQNSRIDYIVIHATSENFAESLRLLTTRHANPVSAHYLVPEIDDPTYPTRNLRIYSLVPEQRRAWHAGVSYWAGEEGLNDRSIGIEIVNEFKCTGTEMPIEQIDLDEVVCVFPPYSEQQIELVIALLKDILERYPGIDPIDVVAHSDVAIMRKSDPGPLFPWHRLYEEGIGIWPDADMTEAFLQRYRFAMPPLESLQSALSLLGYEIEVTGEMDKQTRFALRAFQLRFRPGDYSGRADAETAALIWALLSEYRREELGELNLSMEPNQN